MHQLTVNGRLFRIERSETAPQFFFIRTEITEAERDNLHWRQLDGYQDYLTILGDSRDAGHGWDGKYWAAHAYNPNDILSHRFAEDAVQPACERLACFLASLTKTTAV